MRVALSLLILVGLTYLINILSVGKGMPEEHEAVRTMIVVGLLMIGAWLAGQMSVKISLPAVTGYLVYGLVVGPSILSLIHPAQIHRSGADASPTQFAGDLAIALIALSAGGEIHLGWLKGRTKKILVLLAFHILILLIGIVGLVLLAAPHVDLLSNENETAVWVVAVLAGVVMVAKSPAVTIAMINDYRAAGPLSQTTLVVTVFKDLVLIVMFAGAMAFCKAAVDETSVSGGFLLVVGIELIGSILLGGVIGVVMVAYVRRVKAHYLFFVIGCCFMVALLGEQKFAIMKHHGHLEPLLMALSAGLIMKNLWPEGCEPIFHTIESMSLPIYCLFFSLAGARIDLQVFAELWYLSLGLVVVRLFFTWGGLRLGIKAAGIDEKWSRCIWLGMISQAGVSLVLVTLIVDGFPDSNWAVPLKTAMVGAIFINQLIGPVCFRYGLVVTDEVGKAEVSPRR